MNPALIEIKREKNGVYFPIPLTKEEFPELKQRLQSAINFLESNIDNIFNEIKEKFPENICSSIKYSQALKTLLLSQFYHAGIPIDNKFIDPNRSQLRIRLFDLVNQRCGGYCLPEQHQDIFNYLNQNLEMSSSSSSSFSSSSDLSKNIFSDYSSNLTLQRNFQKSTKKPTVNEVIDALNDELLKALLKRSNILEVIFKKPLLGSEYRKIFYMITRSGLYCDFYYSKSLFKPSQINKNLKPSSNSSSTSTSTPTSIPINSLPDSQMILKVIIPEEIVARSPTLIKNFQRIFYYLWKNYQSQMVCIPKVEIQHRKRSIDVRLDSLKPWFPISQILVEERVSFDSKTEELFFQKITGVSNLFSRVTRDAEIILVPEPEKGINHIMIPDFQLHYHGQSLFIEIIGYWSSQYKEHKLHQLNHISPEWHNRLILLIDEKLNFPKTPFPTFIYQKNQFPLKELEEYTKKWEIPQYENIKSQIIPQLFSGLQEMVEKNEIISLLEIQQKLGLETLEETRFLLKECWDPLNLNGNFTKLSPSIIVANEKIEQWFQWIDTLFKQRSFRSIAKDRLLNQLPDDLPPPLLDSILRLKNYKIDYSNLFKITVRYGT